jgi:hypothetical protein
MREQAEKPVNVYLAFHQLQLEFKGKTIFSFERSLGVPYSEATIFCVFGIHFQADRKMRILFSSQCYDWRSRAVKVMRSINLSMNYDPESVRCKTPLKSLSCLEVRR